MGCDDERGAAVLPGLLIYRRPRLDQHINERCVPFSCCAEKSRETSFVYIVHADAALTQQRTDTIDVSIDDGIC